MEAELIPVPFHNKPVLECTKGVIPVINKNISLSAKVPVMEVESILVSYFDKPVLDRSKYLIPVSQ